MSGEGVLAAHAKRNDRVTSWWRDVSLRAKVTGVTVAVLGLIGVRRSNLQWMAAALTVGLGFGLQEIFANFVSGLILLFERPVRVGDVVTVGDVTGTVANIGTRASTVVDFDRRDDLQSRYLAALGMTDRARAMLFEAFARSFFCNQSGLSAGELVAMFHYYFLGNPEGMQALRGF